MAEITAAAVGKLRAMTNAGLMACKKALTEADGDIEAAVDILRKSGAASAAKKAGRETKEGVISAKISDDGKTGVLVEVNCETDFVAKNDTFREFCDSIAATVLADANADLETLRTEAVSKVGENIVIGRHKSVTLDGTGAVGSYIHTGAKVGVLVEIAAGNGDSVAKDEFQQLVRDLSLQIAATSPSALSREEVDPSEIERESAIVREQMKDKPAQAIEKILQGKLEKYYQGICLVDQAFVKDGNVTIKEHVANVGKALGDTLEIKSFVRFQVGEGS